jgi:hypothetical protein
VPCQLRIFEARANQDIVIPLPLLSRAKRYLADAAHAFERAPVEVVLALLVALGCSWAIEARGAAMREWSRWATAATVAATFAWSGTLLHGLGRLSKVQRWAVTAAGLLAGTLLALFALDFEQRAEGWRALFLLAAAGFWLVALPALAAEPGQRNLMLRRVDGRFSIRTLSAGLYALALFAGLALALRAIEILFELSLRGEIYSHVFVWLMLALVPWIVFGGLPDYVRPLDEVSAVTRGVHRLTRFLVPPLLALYYLILYAYAIRIAVVGELPKNLVSPMVIAAGLLAGAALLLFDAEREEGARMSALRLAPPLFLPLAVLGIWSLGPRIAQYGWTEFRVGRFVLLIALLLLALTGSVLVVQRRRIPLLYIPLTLSLAFLFTALGPFSALAVSRRSQQQHMRMALAEAGLPTAEAGAQPTSAGRAVPVATYERINSISQYLKTHFGESALAPMLAAQARTPEALTDLSAHFGLVRQPAPGQRMPFFGSLPPDARLELDGARLARRVIYPITSTDTLITVRADSAGLITITVAQDTLGAHIGPVLEGLTSSRGEPVLRPESAALPVLGAAGNRRGTLIVFSINGERSAGNIRISHLDGLLLLDSVAVR